MSTYGYLEDDLVQFGLTHQEAVVYVTLLLKGCLTGYEVAKSTGISRSNTYTALAGLSDKGAASYFTEGNVTKYVPVELEEFTGNILYKLQKTQKRILDNKPEPIENCEGYITISGYDNSIDKIRNMILSASKRIYFVANNDMIEIFKKELELKISKGIKVVILSNKSENKKNVEVEGSTTYIMDDMKSQVRLIIDSTDVFTGNVEEKHECSCLYSKNSNFVDVFKEMLRSEIVLLEQKYNKKDTVLVAMSSNI